MKNSYTQFSTVKTPQSQPVPGKGQVAGRGGGYVFELSDWDRLNRFLVLGSDAPTYYASSRTLTTENANIILCLLKEDGKRVVDTIVDVSQSGRAPNNDPALFALAIAAGKGGVPTRKYAIEKLPQVARYGTALFHFAEYVQQFRGWGRTLREGVADWYTRDVDDVAYQAVKYRQRDGWTHRDLLRLSHPKPPTPEHDGLFGWITQGETENVPALVEAYEKAKTASEKEIVSLITEHGLTREMIPTEHLNSPDVWEALLYAGEYGMPMWALFRNLGKMTSNGLLSPMGEHSQWVTEKITDEKALRYSRMHPLKILVALNTYERGRGVRGSLTWNPVREIVDAMDGAFYASFGNVEPTDKRTMLALDVSGSMTWGEISGMTGITPRIGSAAMALVTANVETRYMTVAFSSRLTEVSLSPRQRLNDVVQKVSDMPFGSTDCAQPMLHALENGLDVDTFIVYTDSETNTGNIHPFQALQQYRQKMGIPAKLVVVGMVSSGFSIADPSDGGMLDVVGFDTATPQIISDFVS